jgi:hypothetical protein
VSGTLEDDAHPLRRVSKQLARHEKEWAADGTAYAKRRAAVGGIRKVAPAKVGVDRSRAAAQRLQRRRRRIRLGQGWIARAGRGFLGCDAGLGQSSHPPLSIKSINLVDFIVNREKEHLLP